MLLLFHINFGFIGPLVLGENLNTHIYTGTLIPSVLNICTCPYILVYQTQHLRVVPDKIKWGMAEFIHVYLTFAN